MSFRQKNLVETSQRQRMEMYMHGKKSDVFKNIPGQLKMIKMDPCGQVVGIAII